MGIDSIRFIPDVSSYSFPYESEGEWITYLSKNRKKLTLKNLLSNKEMIYDSVMAYRVDKKGRSILVSTIGKDSVHNLVFVSLSNIDDPKLIFSNDMHKSQMSGLNFNSEGDEAVFLISNKPTNTNDIWYYKVGSPKANILASDQAKEIESSLCISPSTPVFSKSGRYVMFYLTKRACNEESADYPVSLDVWHYDDYLIQSEQLVLKSGQVSYLSVIPTLGGRISKLENDFEKVEAFSDISDFAIIKTDSSGDRFWLNEFSENSIAQYWLVSITDTNRKFLPTESNSFMFSPNGKFLTYFNWQNSHYYSYELNTGKILNISKGIKNHTLADQRYMNQDKQIHKIIKSPFGIAGWLNSV
jgi:hypothetical protein